MKRHGGTKIYNASRISSMTIQVHAKIYGLVQGVFFRSNARARAIPLGLKGWIKNTSDGAVELMAQGNAARVEEFLLWCRQGPPAAQVEKVDFKKMDSLGEFKDFSVE